MKNYSKPSVNSIHFMILFFIIVGCKTINDEVPSTSKEREIAVEDYLVNYIGSELETSGWTGNISTCFAGQASQLSHEMVIKRINYFRRMVGLNDNTTLDTSQFSMCQQAALMLTANNSLNHFPPNTWKCWTKPGYDGARLSNLSMGNSTNAVTTLISDGVFGGGNKAAGHRRWILFSETTQFSYGTTEDIMVLKVKEVAGGNKKIPSFIAYPPNGFIPQELVFDRWSFGIPNADFSKATVKMTGPNGAVNLNIVSNSDIGYGDNTIVWEPIDIIRNSKNDIVYDVTISNIGVLVGKKSFSYKVTVIKP
jgi:hypothetical protein